MRAVSSSLWGETVQMAGKTGLSILWLNTCLEDALKIHEIKSTLSSSIHNIVSKAKLRMRGKE